MKTEFEIPIDIKNDLVYCQRALTNHILIHQKIATCVTMAKSPNIHLQKSMKLIEKEIIDIGDEQKLLFNRLRFLIDYHLITKSAKLGEREKLTNFVREELLTFDRSVTGDVRPFNVQARLPEDALHEKYIGHEGSVEENQSHDNSSRNSVSDDVKTELISDDEKLEIMVPDDGHYEQKVYSGPRKPAKQQVPIAANRAGQSLLKPIHQWKMEEIEPDVRIHVVRPEIGIRKNPSEIGIRNEEKPVVQEKPVQQSNGISLSRLRLSEALFKAKNATKIQSTQNNTARVQTESLETVKSEKLTVKCNKPLSSSQSSCGSSSVEIEPLKDEEDAHDLGQEGFLRLFGLFTPAFTAYLMNRRPQRKKRLCTSTERGDFHYGRFELFEKQFANKRNIRQFLYSPPATRAKRRIGSNGTNGQSNPVVVPKRGKGIKSNGSNSSISSNGSNNSSEKVCLTCYKRNNLLQCQKCCGQYHATCHSTTTEILTRRTFCPFCVRQKTLAKYKNCN